MRSIDAKEGMRVQLTESGRAMFPSSPGVGAIVACSAGKHHNRIVILQDGRRLAEKWHPVFWEPLDDITAVRSSKADEDQAIKIVCGTMSRLYPGSRKIVLEAAKEASV